MLDAASLVLDAENVVEEVAARPVPTPVPAPPSPSLTPPPPLTLTLTLTPPPTPVFVAPRAFFRSIAESLPSAYEIDSIRKSSAPVAERRKRLTRLVASAVGVAWLICQVAIGETAIRSLFHS